MHAAEACFGSWLQDRGGTSELEADQAIAQIQRFLELHGNSRFDPWDDFMIDRRTINRAGLRRQVAEGTEYYVYPGVFKTDICAGLNLGEVVKTLVAKDLLRVGTDKPQKVVRLPGETDSMRMYVLKPGIMGTVQDGEGEQEREDKIPPLPPKTACNTRVTPWTAHNTTRYAASRQVLPCYPCYPTKKPCLASPSDPMGVLSAAQASLQGSGSRCF
jgi:hypothetical protein